MHASTVHGWSPLHVACLTGHVDLVQALSAGRALLFVSERFFPLLAQSGVQRRRMALRVFSSALRSSQGV